MIQDIILTSILILLPVSTRIFGKIPNYKKKRTLSTIYVRGIAGEILILLLFLLIDSKSYLKLDFAKLGKGWMDDQGIVVAFFTLFLIPVVLALYSPKLIISRDKTKDELFGYPSHLLPKNYKELFVFSLNIIAGVFFEELFFRQFIFYEFYKTFHLKGDILLVVSAVLFVLPHHYKKAGAMLFIFFIGLLLGKAYQYSGTIIYPIVLHLFLNATLIVLAWKAIKKD